MTFDKKIFLLTESYFFYLVKQMKLKNFIDPTKNICTKVNLNSLSKLIRPAYLIY